MLAVLPEGTFLKGRSLFPAQIPVFLILTAGYPRQPGIEPVSRVAYDNLNGKNLAADGGYLELFCLKTRSEGI
jgi:hypothetical protein